MHNAPPVVFPVGRFVWGRRLAAGLAALVALALAVGCWQSGASTLTLFWAVLAWSAVAVCSAFWVSREWLQNGALAWDGECWHAQQLPARDGPVHLNLMLDGGRFIWVSLTSRDVSARWMLTRHACLYQADMPSCWHGFRCAVYSRQTASVRTT
jgi:hypothetical protein